MLSSLPSWRLVPHPPRQTQTEPAWKCNRLQRTIVEKAVSKHPTERRFAMTEVSLLCPGSRREESPRSNRAEEPCAAGAWAREGSGSRSSPFGRAAGRCACRAQVPRPVVKKLLVPAEFVPGSRRC